MNSIEERVKAYVDDQLIEIYWDAVTHFGTKDLVLVLDESQEVDPVSAHSREKLISQTDVPEFIERKLRKPASDVEKSIKSSDGAFWFMVFSENNEAAACVAVNAKFVNASGQG